MSWNSTMSTFARKLVVLSALVLTTRAATLFAKGFSISTVSRFLGCRRFLFLGVLMLSSKKEFIPTSFKVTFAARQTECGQLVLVELESCIPYDLDLAIIVERISHFRVHRYWWVVWLCLGVGCEQSEELLHQMGWIHV